MRPLAPARSLAVAISLLLATGSAYADDPTAVDLIERGLDLRQAHKDAEALTLFETAQKLAPSPRGQAQVALAQQALGRWVLAAKNLHEALAAKTDPWIESKRPILEQAEAVIVAHLGEVEIVGARGAVFLDGARVDAPDAMTHLRLEVGRHTVELRADGTYPFSRVVDVMPGEVVRIEVEQRPLLAEPVTLLSMPAPPSAALHAPPIDPGHTQRTLGWITLGGAALFVAGGIAGLAVHDEAASNFNGATACTTQASSMLSSQCRSWLDQGNTGSALAVVGFVGGGLVTALSIALLVTAPSPPKGVAMTFPCVPAVAGGAGAWCHVEGTF